MGRGKLKMELIAKEKPRMTTYKKRKKGLMKKAEEFHKLCDVDTCVILFGPKQNDGPPEVEIYPKESSNVMSIINTFKVSDASKRKSSELSEFFNNRKNKVYKDISKLRKANVQARFPSWDVRFDDFSLEQLRDLHATCDTKLQVAKMKLMIKKGGHYLMEDSKSGMPFSGSNTQLNLNIPKYMDFEVYNQHLTSSSMKPFDMQLPAFYSSCPSLQIPRNLPVADPRKMSMMNDDDYTQYGGSVSRSNIPYTQLKMPSFYDPMATMIENVPCTQLNIPYNPRSLSMGYYGPTMQPTVPYGQQVMPNASSHVTAPQFDEFYHIMNVKGFRLEN